MTNHVHLLISADGAEAPGAMMKALGQRYVQYVEGLKGPGSDYLVCRCRCVGWRCRFRRAGES